MVHSSGGIILQRLDLCLVLCSGLLFQEITATQSSTVVAKGKQTTHYEWVNITLSALAAYKYKKTHIVGWV